MTQPIHLPPPPVYVQEPARCWSTAFQSWDEATQSAYGHSSHVSADQLQTWLDPGDDFTGPQGRANVRGIRLTANIGFMRMTAMASRLFRPPQALELLQDGYIYLVFYWATGPQQFGGHAVVIYGADADGFLVMDPMPGQGLKRRPPGYFSTVSLAIYAGVSIWSRFNRDMAAMTARLRPRGPTAAEVMSQVR